MRLSYFAPTGTVLQEGKAGQAILSVMEKSASDTNVKPVGRPRAAHRGTMFEGLRKAENLIVLVVTLLSYGCPRQAIVHAFGLDERTVARWQERAGQHCQKVHEDQVMQAKLNLEHVQADEIRVKGHQMIPWMAMAIMVSTRLWLGGVVSEHRDRKLADQLLGMVKACCLPLSALLVLTDGWAAYPNSIRRAFREKVKRAGKRGRCQLQAWPEIVIGTVIKKTAKKRIIEIIRRIEQGTIERAEELLAFSAGGIELNTAFIERFNGTMRERLASLTRRSRHAAHRLAALQAGMWLVGCTYNFCWPVRTVLPKRTYVRGWKIQKTFLDN
jgi:IS1 family transposase